jgi:hypothetical protein
MQVSTRLPDVDITDAVASLLELHTGTLRICLGDAGQTGAAACTFTSLSDTLNDDEARFQPETSASHLAKAARPS